MPNITKKLLADAFLRQLNQKTLNKITVQDIADEAGVSRKTFYYYFQDIYDLMEWILEEKCRQMLGGVTADTWQDGMLNLLQYIKDNRLLMLNTYSVIDRDTLDNYFARITEPLVRKILVEQPDYDKLCPEDEHVIVELYTYALVGNLCHWIGGGMKGDPVLLSKQIGIVCNGALANIIARFVQERREQKDKNPS